MMYISSDFGISTGLINQNYWENSKWYCVNVERGNAADKLNGRNINVSFTNNSNVPIKDYYDENFCFLHYHVLSPSYSGNYSALWLRQSWVDSRR